MIRILEVLGSLPCPPWLAEAVDEHDRRRTLVLHIWALSDKTTAFAALWLARAAAIASRALPGPNLSVEDGLRACKANLLR